MFARPKGREGRQPMKTEGKLKLSEKRRTSRTLSILGVGLFGLGSMMGAGSAAMAAPQDFGNIDFSRDGSLTVHKFLHQAGGTQGDISQAPAPGDFDDPVEDVVFTVYPVLQGGAPLDLSVPANWELLETMTPGAGCTAPAGFDLGTPVVMPATDADGTATTTLPIGAYQVCETFAPPQIVDRALPFLLTVPMPHESGWVYDVHAYPKNGAGEIIKTIDPQTDTGLGSVLTFPVTVPVPTVQETWTGFAISDTLDARLDPIAASAVTVTADGTALDTSFYTVDVTGQDVVMNFTGAGLAWLNEGPNDHAGAEITVTFGGTVTSVGNGQIVNQATLWPNNPTFDPAGRQLPSNDVRTNWGSLQVEKRAAGVAGPEGTLNGAVFEVYNAQDPYAADCSTAVAAGAAITVNGDTEFTSSGSGVIDIAGLFVSDSENPAVDADQRCYVLKEIVAPAGYVLPAQPFTAVTVLIGQTTIADNAAIENTQATVPPLPLTGAAGQIVLIVGGIGVLGIAFGLLLLKRRRMAAATEA